MAAVLALVMLPIVAAVGCFIAIVRSDGSASSAFAATTFIALTGFVLTGALRIARDGEGRDTTTSRVG
jgi:hypothetical protein